MKREIEIYDILKTIFLNDKFNDQNNYYNKRKNETKTIQGKNFSNKFFFCDQTYLSSWEIMLKVYGSIPFFVKISAQWNVLHHLDKLKKEKKIDFCWPDLWRIRSV